VQAEAAAGGHSVPGGEAAEDGLQEGEDFPVVEDFPAEVEVLGAAEAADPGSFPLLHLFLTGGFEIYQALAYFCPFIKSSVLP